jgi:hypothetical protein
MGCASIVGSSGDLVRPAQLIAAVPNESPGVDGRALRASADVGAP